MGNFVRADSDKPKQLSRKDSSGFSLFAMCVSGRSSSFKSKQPLSGNGLYQATKKKRRKWNFIPPPPPSVHRSGDVYLDGESGMRNRSRSQDSISALEDPTVREGDVEHLEWAYDRVGDERILVSSFVDVMQSDGTLVRKLLVLTSEAYFLMSVLSREQRWRNALSASSFSGGAHASSTSSSFGDSSADGELYQFLVPGSNPLLGASDRLFKDSSFRPAVDWRRPYGALGRVCLDVCGNAVHIQHKSTDIPELAIIETLTFITYVNGSAKRIAKTFEQMFHEWAMIEQSLTRQLRTLSSEEDVPMKSAIRKVMKQLRDNSLSERLADSQWAPNPLFSLDGSSFSVLGDDLEGILISPVQHISKKNKQPVAMLALLTPENFALIQADWRAWEFEPRDLDESDQNRGPGSSNNAADKWSQKQSAKKAYESIIKVESGCRETSRSLNTIQFLQESCPILQLSFGSKNHEYELMFYDYHTAVLWERALVEYGELVESEL